MISTPCSTFLATSSTESAFPMPIRGRQKPASVCTDSGWVIRNTAWRTSLAVNSPHFSWNLTPLRRVIVQLLPSGAIAHFSASSGMYCPVLRSMPTRYSRAGRLSSWPLRLCSQVKLVSHPRGATAILSRSSFAFAGAGGVTVCARAPATTQPMTPSIPSRHARRRDCCIVLSSFVSRAHALREVLLALLPSVAYRLAPPLFYECWHLAQAIVGQALPAEPRHARLPLISHTASPACTR